MSYGIYLWHLFAIKIGIAIPGITPVQALGVTLLFAATSWHVVEKPILEYGRRLHAGRPTPCRPAGASEF